MKIAVAAPESVLILRKSDSSHISHIVRCTVEFNYSVGKAWFYTKEKQ